MKEIENFVSSVATIVILVVVAEVINTAVGYDMVEIDLDSVKKKERRRK